MPEPFSIRIFAPNGESDYLKIDRFGWSGKVIAFPRNKWNEISSQDREFDQSGVYILIGNDEEADVEDTEVLRIYVGQAGVVRYRIDQHIEKKSFWDRGVVFVSTGDILNRAHTTWLEAQLIKRAEDVGFCKLDNGNSPQEPELAEPDRADIQSFYNEILRVLPLVNIHAFEPRKIVSAPDKLQDASLNIHPSTGDDDVVVVVPANVSDDDGKKRFESAFLGENERNEHCWFQIRIHSSRLDKIKYIAVYQSSPHSAITHFAPVDKIESYGDSGKYKLVFAEPAKEIKPIKNDRAGDGIAPRSPFYTTLSKLKSAKSLAAIWGNG